MSEIFEYKNERLVRRERPQITATLGVIVCCAGYGKSAYLKQLAEDNEGSVHIELAPFYNSTHSVAQLLSEHISDSTHGLDDCQTVRLFIESLSGQGGLLLIDNADQVTDRAASALLGLLCEAAAQGRFRLLAAGRDVPAYMLSYLMNGRAVLFGIDDMRLTRSETACCLRLLDRAYDDKYVNTLYSYTDGWCAGVCEIAKAAVSADDIEKCIGKTLLERYISCELLSDLDEGLAEQLKLMSFIYSSDPEFSASVFRIRDSGVREDRIVTAGILRRDDSGAAVLPQVIRCVLAGMLDKQTKKTVTDRASAYYIDRKRFAEAIKLFDVSGNSAAAERILKEHGERFLENYEFELIGYCGNIIEKERRTTDPEVLGILAQYYYYSGALAKMEAAYNMADSRFGKENRYSVCRRLYNGLIRYEGNREMYAENVRSACEYLKENSLPLPFLHQKEKDTLALIEQDGDDSGKLHIYRFGTLRLTVNDNEIQCKSRRSTELIAYMLERNGRPVSRSDIMNALWKDEIPANAVAVLHNIIYGLRRELSAYGLENIISYKSKCYMLDVSKIVPDDSEIIEVCEAMEKGERKKLTARAGVLESYWGRYLGDSESFCSQEKKEYYDRCFVSASQMLADIYKESGDREKELLCLKNASAADPFSEQIVCSYIQCCFALGMPDKAKKKYDEYAKTIDKELGIAPSRWLKNEFLSGFANETEG
ncbi:BTAD domain-containing putative transcriptional regulator [Ruminococcus sp. NK3A76]|uniref:BTAD domain-containing putative transcriptional regulator n=1 Tax=Ruminococcus sp. NK3A76 TaxID=877411 RepID=UPI00048C5D1E|nr:BTAD domain-containing putative transcriptional regulator [Ruminococcus sp. NK3A76]